METNKPKTASDHDRDYFRRLGEFERANDEDARRALFAQPLEARIRYSANRTETATRHTHDDERPEELYERARRLGLYRTSSSSESGR